MGVINWASLYLESKLRKVSSEKSSFLLSRTRVEDMTFTEAKRIKQLKDPKKIYEMVSVYADDKFDNRNGEHKLSNSRQNVIVNMIFFSKGDTQFIEACKTFCSTTSTNKSDLKNLAIESVIFSLTNSKYDYQARYAGRVARDPYLREQPYCAGLVKTIADIEPIEKCRDAYDYIVRLFESDYSEALIAKYIMELIIKKDKVLEESVNISKNQEQINDDKDVDYKPVSDRTAIIEFIDDKPCYSHGTSRPRIKIKSINTLPSTYGVRPR